MRKRLLVSICTLFMLVQSFAQTTVVSGKVADEQGNPLPGVSIINKKTSKVIGVSSTDGSFTFNLQNAEVMVFSNIGYETKEMKANEAMNIVLKQDISSLAEVVVTGTGVATSKRRLGISVESITGDKLPQIPAATLDQALVGKIPGAQISSVSGNPGDKVNIVLRGINNVQGGTRPLIILDGVEIPFENLTTLDISQVERIEVVQGAASASIYGAQGANNLKYRFR